MHQVDTNTNPAQSAGAVEYIVCISEEGKTPLFNEWPWYDSKLSDGEAPAQEILEMGNTSSLSILPGYSDPEG